MKYDLKKTCKLVIPALATLLLISVLGRFLLHSKMFKNLPTVALAPMLLAYALLILVCFIGVPVYMIINYYSGLFGKTSYLTHMLPVTTSQKLLSKMITSFLLSLLSSIVCIASFVITFVDGADLNYVIQMIPSINMQMHALLNMGLFPFLLITGLLVILGMLTSLMSFCTAISLGQIFRKHKIWGAILFYVVLYIINQLLSVIQTVLLIGTIYINQTIVLSLYGIHAGICLIQIGAYYFICHLLMEKHLNLN